MPVLYNELSQHEGDWFRYKWRDRIFRVERINTTQGEAFVLRALARIDGDLASLGVSEWVQSQLLASTLSGLVLVAGHQGSGKTTLVSTAIVQRIATCGGAALCIEDPPEVDIEGARDGGIIQQVPVFRSGDTARLAARALRTDCDLLFLGEVLMPDEAAAVIRQGANGALVFTTIHGESPGTALFRLAEMAEASGMHNAAARLATSVSLVLHLTLGSRALGQNAVRVFNIQALRVTDASVRSMIRDGQWSRVDDVAQRQIFRAQSGKE